MNTEDIRELYAYNRWANRRATDAAAPLPAESFTREIGGSFGSLRGTLLHIMWAEWVWLQRWQGQSPKQMYAPEDFANVQAIRSRWDEIEDGQQNFLSQLTDERLQRRIRYENFQGQLWEYSLAHMMQHLVNHSSYHRGQVITLLRQLGGKPASTDLLLFFDQR